MKLGIELALEGHARRAKACREQAERNRRLGREEKAKSLEHMAKTHDESIVLIKEKRSYETDVEGLRRGSR